jgi:hypothetical protein
VSEWSARRKKAEKADPAALARAPSARTVARLLTVGRERLSKAETITVAAIENGVAVLVEAREIVVEFQGIIRRKALAELDTWISRARGSLAAPSSKLRQTPNWMPIGGQFCEPIDASPTSGWTSSISRPPHRAIGRAPTAWPP